MKEKKFDFEEFSRKAGELLRQGKRLTGKDDIFTPLLKRVLEASLEGELDDHLQGSRKAEKNRRNGHTQKNLKSSLGALRFLPRATATPHLHNKLFLSISAPSVRISTSKYWHYMGVV